MVVRKEGRQAGQGLSLLWEGARAPEQEGPCFECGQNSRPRDWGQDGFRN